MDLDRADLARGHKIQVPMMVIWGTKGTITRFGRVNEVWEGFADGSVKGVEVDSGHYLPEEKPDETVKAILDFALST